MATLKAEIDRPKLERSLKKLAKDFGDTNAQAVARWGVSTCRDLAKQTQVWGDKSKTETDAVTGKKTSRGPLQRQQGAIIMDALFVIRVTNDQYPPKKKKADRLTSVEAVMDWIEINRTRRRARTAHLPLSEKKECDERIFAKAMKIRGKLAGIAKGGWIGAGQHIARTQVGTDRISIGKNYLGYAHKHARLGHGRLERGLLKPSAFLTNAARHVPSSHVLSKGAFASASKWGLVKTLTWYRRAMKAKLGK